MGARLHNSLQSVIFFFTQTNEQFEFLMNFRNRSLLWEFIPLLCLVSQPFNTRGAPGRPPSANKSPYISGAIKRWTDHRPISRDPLCPALPSSPPSHNWSLITWRWAQSPPHRSDRPSWVWHSPPRRYIFVLFTSSFIYLVIFKESISRSAKSATRYKFYLTLVISHFNYISILSSKIPIGIS